MYRFDGSTVLVIHIDVTHTVTLQTTHILPPAGTQNALDESHKKAATQQAARSITLLARCRRAHGARLGRWRSQKHRWWPSAGVSGGGRALRPFVRHADDHLEWFLNPDHLPLVVALREGYFAEAGLDVQLLEPADHWEAEEEILAGRLDVAVTETLHLAQDAAVRLYILFLSHPVSFPFLFSLQHPLFSSLFSRGNHQIFRALSRV